ncbi:MAG: EAL domain-containing protein [Pseudomonadota bacterium]
MTLRKTFFYAFIAAALLVQLSTSLLDLRSAYRDAMDRADESLRVARAVALSFLEERNQLLEVSAKVLAGDFALRSAVATEDLATVASALRNHSSRIDADLAFFVDRNGQPSLTASMASTIDPSLWARVQAEPNRMLVLEDDAGTLHQIVPAAVRAPQVIGWVALGFRLDAQLVGKLKEITGTEITLQRIPNVDLVQGGVSPSARVSTQQTMDPNQWLNAAHRLDSIGIPLELVLSRARQSALSGFYQQLKLSIWLTLFGLTVAIALAVWLANRLTRDLDTLATVATGIRGGRYDLALPTMRGKEVQQLAGALSTMQQGIAEREQRIGHQLLHDSLTDLPNQRHALEVLEGWLNKQQPVLLLVVNVRGLRELSATLGLEVGEQAVRCIANTLLEDATVDFVARIADTRFLCMLKDTDQSQLEELAGRIQHRNRLVQVTDQVQARCTFEFGAAQSAAGLDAQSLIGNAWSASLESARQDGKLAWFVDEIRAREARRQILLRDLRVAILTDQLTLHYQLKWSCHRNAFAGVEALLRWQHPELGHVNIEELIALAEQTQEIRLLTRWVLKQALHQQAIWRDAGLELSMAVNISAHDLSAPQFTDYVASLLKEYGSSGADLCLEITEGALVSDFAQAQKTIAEIASAGVRFAIDDYGTGFSSLSQLRNLTASALKIDKSFVLKLADSPADQQIVESTIKLAHSLGLTVVAEGVENDAAVVLLRSWGCDELQGYHFAKPLPPAEIEPLLTAPTADLHPELETA